MKKLGLLLLSMTLTAMTIAQNPFLKSSKTPHGTFPFNELKNEHFMPALKEGMKQHDAEIQAIVNNKKPATFENTIVALERSGALLDRVVTVFYALNGAETNDGMREIAREISPLLTNHSNNIKLNEKLFARIKTVYEQKDKLNLNTEDAMLLQNTFDSFADNGANLNAEEKEKYRELSSTLSLATLEFGQNTVKETNAYFLNIKDKALLSGLSDDYLEMAAAKAAKRGVTGWVIDLTAPSFVPFMKYADNRDLRRELYVAYNTQCNPGSEFDNTQNLYNIVNLRREIAQLFGYNTFADYALRRRMAETPANVYKLLNELLEAYKPAAIKEVAAVQAYADKQGAYFKVQAWDWSYYAEKLKDEQYSISDETLRPYFELENVKKGVFGLATRLYGITFKKNTNIQVYNPEVDAYEVYDKNGKFLSVLYTDFHPREGKRSGAWMTLYKGQKIDTKGNNSRPHVTIVMNFTRPTASKPALLTFDEMETFLHEFGHALHGMFANTKYESMSGTSVYRDFVELPSQLMENWSTENEFLNSFAVNYETGEKIPAELIEKIKASANFNVAYACLRQLSFGFMDMAYYTTTSEFKADISSFEKEAIAKTQILPEIPGTNRSTTFNHIFSGGYSAGYYSYKWAEVLDADAYAMFQEHGIFNQETADAFRENVLSKGGTENPMVLYKRFRGSEPTIDALLKRNNIEKPTK